MFEPEYPMTAADAATKRVGDPLNLDGTDVRVTLVDESRIYHIEGKAPEGEEVGDVAQYFNAEAGDKMQVVSWTGDELEYYNGIDLTRGTVAKAFGLSSETPMGSGSSLGAQGVSSAWSGSTADHYDSTAKFVMKAVGVVLGAAILFAVYSLRAPTHRPATVLKFSAPPTSIKVGSYGRLDDKNYRITGHAMVEIAEVGLRIEQHEFELRDDDGNEALLIYGWKAGAMDWYLYTTLHPLEPMSPHQAGAVRWGEAVNLDGIVARVKELFCSTVLQAESPNGYEFKAGRVSYGFSAQIAATILTTRWNENEISFHQGKFLPGKAVTDAFGQQAGK
jgi:hypothetical protein